MLNKDKIDEVGANLGAVKNERNIYIPRAVIKRLKSARLMPFGGRTVGADGGRSGEAASASIYVILSPPNASAVSIEM